MNNTPNGQYFKDFIRCLALALIVVIYLLSLTSCSVFKSLKKDQKVVSTDSTNLHKIKEVESTIDTSKTKTESKYTKETFIFPPYQRDTTINKFYNSYPVQYIKETGSSATETNNYNYQTREKQLIDSMRIANLESQLSLKQESKVKAGIGLIEWILIIGLGL